MKAETFSNQMFDSVDLMTSFKSALDPLLTAMDGSQFGPQFGPDGQFGLDGFFCGDYFDAAFDTREGVGFGTQQCSGLASLEQCNWNPKSCDKGFNSRTEFNRTDFNTRLVCDKEVSDAINSVNNISDLNAENDSLIASLETLVDGDKQAFYYGGGYSTLPSTPAATLPSSQPNVDDLLDAIAFTSHNQTMCQMTTINSVNNSINNSGNNLVCNSGVASNNAISPETASCNTLQYVSPTASTATMSPPTFSPVMFPPPITSPSALNRPGFLPDRNRKPAAEVKNSLRNVIQSRIHRRYEGQSPLAGLIRHLSPTPSHESFSSEGGALVLTPEDEERRRKRRERNKVAATKCRNKKKLHSVHLLKESVHLEAKNEEIKREIDSLRREAKQLSELLARHRKQCRVRKRL